MKMSKSSLIDVTVPAYSGNYTKGRSGRKIEMITIHHMAGVLSAEQCGKIFQAKGRNGSSHYGIGNDGRIGFYVDEANTAWTNSNWDANCKAVTIETSNSSTGGQWPVGDKALNSLIKLVADIAKRNNLGTLVKGKNVTWHRMYTNTTCPGDYLLSKMDYIVAEANKINNGSSPKPTTKKIDVKYQVYAGGKWWSDITNYNNVNANGYAGYIGSPISGLRGNTVGTVAHAGHLKYRVHQKGGSWLGWITDRQKDKYGDNFAGILGKPIDGVQIKSTKGTAVYRVHLKGGNWLSWVSKVDNTSNGYAGIYGREIDAIQIYIK